MPYFDTKSPLSKARNILLRTGPTLSEQDKIYRVQEVMKHLRAWLRDKGIKEEDK